MQRNKVYPSDNGGQQSINACNLARNSAQRKTDGVSRQSRLIKSNDLQHQNAIASSIPPPSHLEATTGGNPHLQDRKEIIEQLGLENKTAIVTRWVVTDHNTTGEEQETYSGVESPLSSDIEQSTTVINNPWSIAEESMEEQYEIDSNSPPSSSAAERDLLKYFTELNNNEDSEIDVNEITRILSRGADVNARGDNGQTCIHIAAGHWKKEVVQLLKERGANLDLKDDYGVTPLHKAARVDNEEVVRYLIENNPNISHVTTDTLQTALHHAVLGSAVNSIYVCTVYKLHVSW